MKSGILLIIMVPIMLSFSCGKEDSPNDPSNVTYSLTDLLGSWDGEVKNSSNTISLDINVDSAGKVSGNGVSSQWSIDTKGKVTGSGSFGFMSGSYYIIASSSWSLQLDSKKTNLSGEFNVAYSGLHNMAVNLDKK